MDKSMEQLFTVKQAAEYLAISKSTVKRLVAGKRITFIKIGTCVRFDKKDLDSYVQSHRSEVES